MPVTGVTRTGATGVVGINSFVCKVGLAVELAVGEATPTVEVSVGRLCVCVASAVAVKVGF